jgi:phenylalanyl-tRNA synthetase beta chain
MTHGLFTDAVTRFNKGQSPLQNLAVLAKVAEDVSRFADGKAAGTVYDDNEIGDRQWVHPPVPVTTSFVNERLGLTLNADKMKQLLEAVEFDVTVNGEVLTVTAPFWRTDIEQREDVVEEIGRLYGFDHLPLVLPSRVIAPTRKDSLLELKRTIRAQLAKSGANEVLTYSFVHGNLLDKVGQDKSHAFQISNAISPDLQYYRLSLTPSLLEKVHANIKAGYDKFVFFEMGRVHYKGEVDAAEPEVPNEDDHLSLVIAAADKTARTQAGAPYYAAKKYLLRLLPDADAYLAPLKGFDFKDDEWGRQLCMPYDPNRSAVIVWNDLTWGIVGEFKSSVVKALKLPVHTAGFEVGLEMLRHAPHKTYRPLPRFPKVDQDICFKVSAEMPYRTLHDFVAQKIAALQPEQSMVSLSPVDIYQRSDDQMHKQITLRVSIANYERTLTDEEVAKLLDEVAAAAKGTLHAERV